MKDFVLYLFCIYFSLSPVFGTHVQEDSVLTQNGSDVAFSPNVSDHHDSPRKFIETNAKCECIAIFTSQNLPTCRAQYKFNFVM